MSAEVETKYLWDRRSDLRLRALMNRIYYQERQRIFEWRDGIVKVVAILAGSVSFANLANTEIIKFCVTAITVTSAASLVFGFGTKARDSARRSADWALLERDMERVGERNYTEEQLNEWTARCNEIEAGEPSSHPGLMERSYLRACAAMGSKPKHTSRWLRYRPAIIIH
jgi:hypothetical protein